MKGDGVAPDRRLTIEFIDVRSYYTGNDKGHWEATLHENGDIVLQYAYVSLSGPNGIVSNGRSATAGVTGPWGRDGTTYSYDEPRLRDGTAIRFRAATLGRNLPPVADAGPDRSVKQRTTFTLDGRASRDPDGAIVRWYWNQIYGPPLTIVGADTPTPTIRAPKYGWSELLFELIVTDDRGAAAADIVSVRITK